MLEVPAFITPIADAQYASRLYRDVLVRLGLIGSMSAPGNPYNNAQAESFMKTLKVEEVYLAGFETFRDVANRLPYFIEQIYNERRLHSALGYQSPNKFEAQLALQALTVKNQSRNIVKDGLPCS
jgi:putative transposase